MNATKEDIKEIHAKIDNSRSELHAKIDNNRNELYDVAKPFNDLAIKVGELVVVLKASEKDKERIEANQIQQGKDISELRRDYAALRLETLVAIKELSTNQNGILSIAGKLAVPLLGLASTASAVMIFLKMG